MMCDSNSLWRGKPFWMIARQHQLHIAPAEPARVLQFVVLRAGRGTVAFGGEAQPEDYARVMADAGLLAMVACLGLAQASHEVTPMAAQLCLCSMLFCAIASLNPRSLCR